MWWTPDKGMLHLHGQLPDVMGATFEATIQKLTEQMKPATGQAWDSFEHRAADALHELCDQPEEQDETPSLATRPVLQTLIPLSGPAEIAGIPIADSRLEQLRANASIEPVLVDDDGTPIAIGKRFSALSPKIVRAVLLRDQGCRICGRRHRLQIHHLRPRSWGGTDEISDLASVCTTCHPDLIPHGDHALVGNPNVPGDLHTVRLDDLTTEQREQVGLPPRTRRAHRGMTAAVRSRTMSVNVVPVPYGEPAARALFDAVVAGKGGDPLAPVTVVVPTNYVGVAARRLLARGTLGRVTPGGDGVAGVTFLTVYRLAELLGAPRLAGVHRRPVSTPVLAAAVRAVLATAPGIFGPVADHPATEAALVDAYRELAAIDDAALDALACARVARAADVVRITRRARAGWRPSGTTSAT